MKRSIADTLMQFTADHADQIGELWYKAISTNPRTQAYQFMNKETCLRHAEFICKNLNRLYFSENCAAEVSNLLDADGFVEDHYARNIPLDQIIYGIILLRRQLWLYADFQSLYNSIDDVDMLQMVYSINRVLLVFDYIISIATGKYRLVQLNFKK